MKFVSLLFLFLASPASAFTVDVIVNEEGQPSFLGPNSQVREGGRFYCAAGSLVQIRGFYKVLIENEHLPSETARVISSSVEIKTIRLYGEELFSGSDFFRESVDRTWSEDKWSQFDDRGFRSSIIVDRNNILFHFSLNTSRATDAVSDASWVGAGLLHLQGRHLPMTCIGSKPPRSRVAPAHSQ